VPRVRTPEREELSLSEEQKEAQGDPSSTTPGDLMSHCGHKGRVKCPQLQELSSGQPSLASPGKQTGRRN
jgi:hypothetical protein